MKNELTSKKRVFLIKLRNFLKKEGVDIYSREIQFWFEGEDILKLEYLDTCCDFEEVGLRFKIADEVKVTKKGKTFHTQSKDFKEEK